MKLSLIVFLVIFANYSDAQQSFYQFAKPGKYSVCYVDTIIYDSEIQYEQYGYSGSAPLFVQIWFPSNEKLSGDYLRLGELKPEYLPFNLAEVYAGLNLRTDEIIIRDAIEYNISTDEPIAYGNRPTTEILDRLKQIPTMSRRGRFATQCRYPVIVYHHGSQGVSYENYAMAEYFASRGYVFVSANFHLPYENTIYGLLPYDLEAKSKYDQSSAKTLTRFAQSITSNNNVYFVGHSWGAQEGWCFLGDSTYVDAFVSMETTIEYKSDSTEIREKWPYVYESIKVKKEKFSIPVLMFASMDTGLNFEFFKGLSSEEEICAAYKKPFAHNSYTSIFMLRYFTQSEIPVPDAEILLAQIEGYCIHLFMMNEFFRSCSKNKKFRKKNFVKDFEFH